MDIRFDRRVAIVTGAGRGIGRQYAMDLAARGAKVVVNDLGCSVDGYGADPTIAPKVVEEIRAAGGEAIANVSDMRTPQGASEAVDAALAAFGTVDIVVNNAGIARDRTILEMSCQDFTDMMNTHATSAFNCTKAAWPIMAEKKYGRVVMISSDSGLYGMFNQANYSAAKAAMLGLMHALAIEGRPLNIYVNAIAPQAMTRMSEGYEVSPEMRAALDPKWPSAAMLFLCAEHTNLTNQVMHATMGYYAMAETREARGIIFRDGVASPERIRDRFNEISDMSQSAPYQSLWDFFEKVAPRILGQAAD